MKKLVILIISICFSGAYAQDSLGVSKLGQLTYPDIVNDVWGWSDGNGREFALVGINSGLSIVEVTNPSAPVELHFIAGAYSTWRDIKTWKNHAYVVHDNAAGLASDGIRIIDMTTVDSANISYTSFAPMVMVDTNIYFYRTAHNIFIDEQGVLYLFGSNIASGGAVMFDVDSLPNSPQYQGIYDDSYFHDGVARGDTLWGAAITKGRFEVVDVSNPSNPVMLASQVTPNTFCHNIWFSDDNQTVFTTDEKKGAFVTAYDVSDLNNINELDRIRTGVSDPNQVIPHNTHVLGDFLVTSYYTSGVQIVDASRPDILVETAYYDTSPLSGDGFDGSWGAYPYLPSGNLLVTDRQEGLFVLSTNYPRASYFTAFVKDSVTGNPIVNANIEMLNTDIAGASNIFGNFRDGQRDSGSFEVVVSKAGYITDTINVNMQAGAVAAETIALLPLGFSVDEPAFSDFIRAYPNPNHNQFNLELANYGNQELRMEVYSAAGVKLIDRSIYLANGKAEINHGLSSGMYLVRVMDAKKVLGAFRLSIN